MAAAMNYVIATYAWPFLIGIWSDGAVAAGMQMVFGKTAERSNVVRILLLSQRRRCAIPLFCQHLRRDLKNPK